MKQGELYGELQYRCNNHTYQVNFIKFGFKSVFHSICKCLWVTSDVTLFVTGFFSICLWSGISILNVYGLPPLGIVIHISYNLFMLRKELYC